MPRPAGTPPRPWDYGLDWEQQTVEYNRVTVDYLNMTDTFKAAFQKTVLHRATTAPATFGSGAVEPSTHLKCCLL
eukprot:979103-Amphidinium_carterae.3